MVLAGGATRYADYTETVPGTAFKTVLFRYVVQPGDASADLDTGNIIDVNGGRGLDELYAELDAGADVAEFAARACLTRGWSTLPGDDSGRPCAVALADAARGTGEVDALRELRASVDARLAALGAAPACAEDEAPTGT